LREPEKAIKPLDFLQAAGLLGAVYFIFRT